MSKVSEDKMQFRIQRWKELLKNCKESGLTIKEWTSKNNISRNAYYYRFRKIKSEGTDSIPAQETKPSFHTFSRIEFPTVRSTQAPILKWE